MMNDEFLRIQNYTFYRLLFKKYNAHLSAKNLF